MIIQMYTIDCVKFGNIGIKEVYRMLVNCKECGAEISDLAKHCPRCGYPISKKSKLSIASFVMGIISISYSFVLFINNLFTDDKNGHIVPSIIIIGILAIIFGIFSIQKPKSKEKSLLGIILGILSIFISILSFIFL